MAAAVCALGISLSSMVAKITLRRGTARCAPTGMAKNRLKVKARELEKLRLKALSIVDSDPVIFRELSRAFRLNKKSRTAKYAKKLDGILSKAYLIQAELMTIAGAARRINDSLKNIVRGALREDLRISDLTLDASFKSALITAELNARCIKNPALRKKTFKQLLCMKKR